MKVREWFEETKQTSDYPNEDITFGQMLRN
jgi:hypothetical protein